MFLTAVPGLIVPGLFEPGLAVLSGAPAPGPIVAAGSPQLAWVIGNPQLSF